MRFVLRAMPVVLLGMASPGFAADCGREDIDHYLDRGFTPQQVLELCRGQAASSSAPTLEQAHVRGEHLRFLRDAVDGHDLSLGEDVLAFSRDLCVKYDRPNYAEQRKSACGVAHYKIGLQGLKVLEASRKVVFWGSNEVRVGSPLLEKDYQLGQDALSERDQRKLAEELGKDAQAVLIPVREGVAVDAVRARLEELAR